MIIFLEKTKKLVNKKRKNLYKPDGKLLEGSKTGTLVFFVLLRTNLLFFF